jgi:hypothetical protein
MMLESSFASAKFIVFVAIIISKKIAMQYNYSLGPVMAQSSSDSCRGELYGNDPHF